MFSHVTIGSNNLERSGAFYDAMLKTLGHERFYTGDQIIGYGEPTGDQTFITSPFDGEAASVGNGTHIAFLAQDRAAVDAFHAAAMAHGGTDEGAPGPRPHYHKNYYGAYVRDPDGNKLQATCHRNPD